MPRSAGNKLQLCAPPSQPPPDDGIYWQVNMERFHQHFRDQAIVSAVANRMDQVGGGGEGGLPSSGSPTLGWGGGGGASIALQLSSMVGRGGGASIILQLSSVVG